MQKASWTGHFRRNSTERASFIDSGVKRSSCPSEASLEPICAHHPIRCCQGQSALSGSVLWLRKTLLVHQTWDCGRSTMSHETPVPGRETFTFQILCVIWFHAWWPTLLKQTQLHQPFKSDMWKWWKFCIESRHQGVCTHESPWSNKFQHWSIFKWKIWLDLLA